MKSPLSVLLAPFFSRLQIVLEERVEILDDLLEERLGNDATGKQQADIEVGGEKVCRRAFSISDKHAFEIGAVV
jgi:hypothetical protein